MSIRASEKEKSYTGIRSDIANMITWSPKRILDVGCSTGSLGKFLKSKYKDLYICGIETDPISIDQAKTILDKVLFLDLDYISEINIDEYFDLIILADVLEHTKFPEKVLNEIQKYLSQDGFIIISLPNIQHWTAIISLISGEWPENERGIFDYTHLRFFTKKSIFNLSKKAQLNVIKIERNYRFFDKPNLKFNKLSIIMKYFPFKNFFTYQYRVILKK